MPPTNPQHHAGPAAGEDASVLVVEDHVETADALGGILRRAGYDVTIAHGVAEAQCARDGRAFRYLLCDINLPDGQGYEVLRYCRAQGAIRGFAITALCDREDYEASIAAGFEAHFVKPLSVTRILKLMGCAGPA